MDMEGEGEGSGGLAATIDGAALPDDEARALWAEFSQHMDEHKGDTEGFARQKGWAGAAPVYRGGQAVLIVWTQGPPPAELAAKQAAPPRRPPGARDPRTRGRMGKPGLAGHGRNGKPKA